jgi:hypothetical protein
MRIRREGGQGRQAGLERSRSPVGEPPAGHLRPTSLARQATAQPARQTAPRPPPADRESRGARRCLQAACVPASAAARVDGTAPAWPPAAARGSGLPASLRSVFGSGRRERWPPAPQESSSGVTREAPPCLPPARYRALQRLARQRLVRAPTCTNCSSQLAAAADDAGGNFDSKLCTAE